MGISGSVRRVENGCEYVAPRISGRRTCVQPGVLAEIGQNAEMVTSRRLITVLRAALPVSPFLAAPAFASNSANQVVYTADPGTPDGFYGVVLADPGARSTRTVLKADVTGGV